MSICSEIGPCDQHIYPSFTSAGKNWSKSWKLKRSSLLFYQHKDFGYILGPVDNFSISKMAFLNNEILVFKIL